MVTVGSLPKVARLWTLKTDGSDAHPLLPDWPENADQTNGQWTQDGQHFVFTSTREGRGNVYELVRPPWFEFWKKPHAVRITGNQVSIQASTPAHDSKSLFVIGRLDQGAMQVLDLQTKRFVPYLNGFSALQFVISPDRQWMAYTEYPTMNLWKSRIDGSDPVQLTHSPAFWDQWSPDGKLIAYMDWQKIYIISADGGAPQTIPPTGGDQVAPYWSPDGKSLYFNDYPYPGQPHKGLYVFDLASRQLSIMPGSQGYYVPLWSPDGRYLIAAAQNPSRMVLYTAATGQWKDLKLFDFPWGYCVWANDSKSIYMIGTEGQSGVFQLTIPGGIWTKISGLDGVNVSPAGWEAFVSLTADNRPVFMSDTSVSQIYSLRWK